MCVSVFEDVSFIFRRVDFLHLCKLLQQLKMIEPYSLSGLHHKYIVFGSSVVLLACVSAHLEAHRISQSICPLPS